MMKKNVIKIISCTLIILLFINISTVEATSVIGDIQNNMKTNTSVSNSVVSTGKTVMGVLDIIATGIAILMLLYIAIKYMMSAPEGKAEYKKTATVYAIGAVIIFIAPKLASAIMKVSQNITGKLG